MNALRGERLHDVTRRALSRRAVAASDLARLLQCTVPVAQDILDGRQPLRASEAAIIRLVCNVKAERLVKILRGLKSDYEWREIAGFEKYEVSVLGDIRRAARGAGSVPGVILRPTLRRGYPHVTLYDNNGKMVTVGIHRTVCRAFHGDPPSQKHIACHKNDVRTDNRDRNLYWGLPIENARDREANMAGKIVHGTGTLLAQRVRSALRARRISASMARKLLNLPTAYEATPKR